MGAFAFPLVRKSEYEADTLSVRLVSRQAAVEALCGSHMLDRYLQELYWPSVRNLAEQHSKQNLTPYQAMGGDISAQLHKELIEFWLAQEVLTKPDAMLTHPCLLERLKALQASPCIVLARTGQTAEGLLGSALQPITAQLDKNWQEHEEADKTTN